MYIFLLHLLKNIEQRRAKRLRRDLRCKAPADAWTTQGRSDGGSIRRGGDRVLRGATARSRWEGAVGKGGGPHLPAVLAAAQEGGLGQASANDSKRSRGDR